VSKRLGSRYRSGRSLDWLKFKNPDAPAVRREGEEEWGEPTMRWPAKFWRDGLDHLVLCIPLKRTECGQQKATATDRVAWCNVRLRS
jgi:hypothetical protein